ASSSRSRLRLPNLTDNRRPFWVVVAIMAEMPFLFRRDYGFAGLARSRLAGRASGSSGPAEAVWGQYRQAIGPGTRAIRDFAVSTARKWTGMWLRGGRAGPSRNRVIHSSMAALLVAAAKVSASWSLLRLYARATFPLVRPSMLVYCRASVWSR